MFKKSSIAVTILVAIFAGSIELHASHSYLGWRIFSNIFGSDQSRIEQEEQKKKEAEAKRKAEEQRKIEETARRVREERARKAAEEKRIAEETARKIREEKEKKIAEEKRIAERKRLQEERARKYEQFKKDTKDFFAQSGENISKYASNRLSDICDCLTAEVGVGEVGFNLYLTRYANLGAGLGYAHMAGFTVYDQCGVYREQSWYLNLLQLSACDVMRLNMSGNYNQFYRMNGGLADIAQMKLERAEDPYALGFKVCCYANLKLQFHPVEIADFVAGVFCIDLQDDDK